MIHGPNIDGLRLLVRYDAKIRPSLHVFCYFSLDSLDNIICRFMLCFAVDEYPPIFSDVTISRFVLPGPSYKGLGKPNKAKIQFNTNVDQGRCTSVDHLSIQSCESSVHLILRSVQVPFGSQNLTTLLRILTIDDPKISQKLAFLGYWHKCIHETPIWLYRNP